MLIRYVIRKTKTIETFFIDKMFLVELITFVYNVDIVDLGVWH